MTTRRPAFRASRAAYATCLALVLGACASDPPTRFHSLLPGESPRPALPASGAAAGGVAVPLAITLAPVRVPVQVDQPQWLVRVTDGSLQLLEQDRWAAPLRDELHAALLEALSLRWNATDTRTAAGGPAPGWRIVVDVTRFESVLGREARLEARWSITGTAPGGPALACSSVMREAADTPIAIAQGHQRAVVRLADAIGAPLQALARGQAARCPAVEG
ncbi:MAG: PqiC family protein [Burkholderiaceae bacterium]